MSLKWNVTQNGLSLKMECHSKWIVIQTGKSLKMKCHSKWNVPQTGISLKMECNSKLNVIQKEREAFQKHWINLPPPPSYLFVFLQEAPKHILCSLLTPYITCFPSYLILKIPPLTSYLSKVVRLLVHVFIVKISFFFFTKSVSCLTQQPTQ